MNSFHTVNAFVAITQSNMSTNVILRVPRLRCVALLWLIDPSLNFHQFISMYSSKWLCIAGIGSFFFIASFSYLYFEVSLHH